VHGVISGLLHASPSFVVSTPGTCYCVSPPGVAEFGG
jgi:hypothetical protein